MYTACTQRYKNSQCLQPTQVIYKFETRYISMESYFRGLRTHFLYYSVLSLGGKVNTRRMSQLDLESIFTKIIYEIFWSQETIMCKVSKLSKLNAFNLFGYQTNTDASILNYKFRPKRTGFNMYAEYTQPQLTFLALVPCLKTNTLIWFEEICEK